jgi:hypothetical protein
MHIAAAGRVLFARVAGDEHHTLQIMSGNASAAVMRLL